MPDQIEDDESTRMNDEALPILTPDPAPSEAFTDPAAAVARLEELYFTATGFLLQHFTAAVTGHRPQARIRAFYPEIRLTTTSHVKTDSRLSFGHVAGPGTYSTTVTRPEPPQVKNSAWVRNPIDQFILAKLESEAGRPIVPIPPEQLDRAADN